MDDTKYFDKKNALKAVKKSGWELEYVSEELKNDKDVVLEAVKGGGYHFEHAGEALKNDKEFILKASKQDIFLKKDPYGGRLISLLEHSGEEPKRDREFILEVLRQNYTKKSREGKEEFNFDDEGISMKQIFLQALRLNIFSLGCVSEELRNDREVVLEGLKNETSPLREPLEFVSEELRNDRELVLFAVKRRGFSWKYVSEELKKDREVLLEAVKQSGFSLFYVGDELKNDKEVVLVSVKQDGKSLKYASEELKNDKEVVLEAVKQRSKSLKYSSEELQKDKEVLHYSKLSRPKEVHNKKIDDDDIIDFLSQQKKLSPNKTRDLQKLKKLIDPYIKRSDIDFELGRFEACFEDLLVSFQLLKLVEETPEVVELKEMILGKFKRTFEVIVKKDFSPHENIPSAVKKQVLKFVEDFSWMEGEETKIEKERVFLNEWNEGMIPKMKKVVVDNVRFKISETLSTRKDLLKSMKIEHIRSSIFQKYVQQMRFSWHSKHIQDDTKEEIRNLVKGIVSPSSFLSHLLEEDIKCLDLSTDRENNSERSLKYFGFSYEHSTRFGFGLEFGEFSGGGGLFGRNLKCRRLYYGTFNQNGLRHGEKCKEYSERDGSLIYEGNFRNGNREGKGIEYSLDNNTGIPVQIFEGKYRNGKRSGRGESFEKGIVVRGTWRNGVLDESSVFKFECPIFKYDEVKKHLNDTQKVGKGAFGVIYKVKSSAFKKNKETKMEKLVAVKILEKASSSMEQQIMVRMIRRGIGYCYSVKCKYILESYGIILGSGHRGEIGYVMKLCEKSIDKVIEEGKISLEEKIRILKETAIGIYALHDKYLIHRDLKWGNVLLDFDGVVKITDFDTVKEEEIQWRLKTLSQSARIGTPGFRPPEVITGRKYTFKCDVYAFGLMIYALLFEKNFPYITRSHCSCGVKITDIIRNDQLEKHISDCNLRPLMNPDEVNKFPSFLIDLMVQSWDRSAFNRPSFEDIVFMFKFHDKKKVYKLSFQFPEHPGVQDQTMFLIKPFGVEKVKNWIEKKFEKPFVEGEEIKEDDEDEENEGEEEEKETTKVLLLEHSIVGTIHSDEDLIKIFEKEEFPSLKVKLNFIDESFVIDSVNQKISFDEHLKVKNGLLKTLDLRDKRIKELEKTERERNEEIKILKSEIEKLRNEKSEL